MIFVTNRDDSHNQLSLSPIEQKNQQARFFAWRRLRGTVRRLPVAMPDSDSDDSPVRPVPKKGPAARARRRRPGGGQRAARRVSGEVAVGPAL